jgi:hypothetical protein
MFLMVQEGGGPEDNTGAVGKVEMHPLTHWVIDSGCTSHMTPRADLLDEVRPPSTVKYVTAASGTVLPVLGTGNAKVMGAHGELVGLGEVLLVEGLSANLISVSKLQKSKARVTFGPAYCEAKLGSKLLWNLQAKTSFVRNLWQLPAMPWGGQKSGGDAVAAIGAATTKAKASLGKGQQAKAVGEVLDGVDAAAGWAKASARSGEADWETWHERLGHVNFPALQNLVKSGNLKGLAVRGTLKEEGSCPTCLETKFSRFPFESRSGVREKPLALVYMDVDERLVHRPWMGASTSSPLWTTTLAVFGRTQ